MGEDSGGAGFADDNFDIGCECGLRKEKHFYYFLLVIILPFIFIYIYIIIIVVVLLCSTEKLHHSLRPILDSR